MIIVKLQGGLGNQLFQYALGQALQKSFYHSVFYDISSYRLDGNNTQRHFVLRQFGMEIRVIPRFFMRLLFFYDRFLKTTKEILELKYYSIFQCEVSFEFKQLEIKNWLTVLEGYWQSPKYFNSINNQIVAQIFSYQRLSNSSQLLLESLKGKTTISIHFRRGDYMNNQAANDFHGICELDYYEKALLYLDNKMKIDTCVIFTDDVVWVKNNFYLEKYEVIYGSDYAISDVDELLLMATMNHNITANSTFSWWSAFLNPNPEKIIVAPKKWFNDQSINVEDLFPPNWVRL